MAIAGNQGFLKAINRNALLRLLYEHPGASKAELARFSGLAKMTVGALSQELLLEGWVTEGEVARGGAGRPSLPLYLDQTRLCALGAEVGVDYVMVVACDLLGNVIAQVESQRAPSDATDAARRIAAAVAHLCASAALRDRRVLGLSISAPGPVEHDILRFAPNLGWTETDLLETLRPMLAPRSGLRLRLENEANAAALGEYVFRLHGKPRSLVYLSLGVGVGCGIVIEGKVFRGAGGFAGEVGHSLLYPPAGSTEDFVSQRALARQLGYARVPHMGQLLKRAARQPEAVRSVGHDLGLLLANLVNTFSPDELVIGGPLSRLGQDVLSPALEAMRRACRWRDLEMVRVRLCAKQDRAAAIGAAALVVHDLLNSAA